MTRAFLIAGEASGDALGAALMAGLKELEPKIVFDGVAGPLMQAEGMGSLFPMEELSVMGLAEILPKLRQLMRRIRQTADAVIAAKPDVLVTIDSPDFCLRVARIVRAAAPEIRTVHYVAPSVWAWRPKRAHKMAGTIDQVLALLPFEPPYMEAAGMRCDFVGHPIAVADQASAAEGQALRSELAIDPQAPVVLVLPGSRQSEVRRLAPVFGETLRHARQARPELEAILPAAPFVAPLVRDLTAAWKVPVHLLDPTGLAPEQAKARKLAAFGTADVALAASGTVSLELAAAATPMVIAYDANWLTRQIVKRALLIDTVTLVNLVSETRAVPEFLGPDCRAELIAPALLETLAHPEAQLAAANETMMRLGRGGEAPGMRAARSVVDGLGRRPGMPDQR